METIKCKRCGRELSYDHFKMTRWGDFSSVCNECVTKARMESVKAKKEKAVTDTRVLRLSDFTPRELMEELHRRGYEGTLKFVEVHEINIADF